ncbi:MAG: metallophosphoesterase family protein [Ignavibacteriaceae bacterium]
MKIVHISDLHSNFRFRKPDLKKIRNLFGHISLLNPDHIVITGDLTDNAEKNDFLFLRKLFERYGWFKPERLSLTIGNHDIFGGVQVIDDLLNFPEQCRMTDYNRRVRDFISYFDQAFYNCYFPDPANSFPYGKVIGDVLIIGINSVAGYSKIKNPFGSNGFVDLHQFNQITDIAEKFRGRVKTRIVIIHHHFNRMKKYSGSKSASVWNRIERQTMKLRKKKRLLSLFNECGINLVLHGHVHYSEEYTRNGIRFMNGGATISGKKSDPVKFNLITIENDSIQTEVIEITPEQMEEGFFQKKETALINYSE